MGSMERGRARTDDARNDPAILNSVVAYGALPAQRVEWFVPKAAPSGDAPAARPIFVMFHGGWWQEGSIDDGGRYAAAIVAAGGVHVAVGYTLAPAASLRAIVAEAASALAAIASTAADHGGDPKRIVVAGHSAGAHLAASLITALVPESTRDLVTGLLLVGGIYDLSPLAESYVNEKVGMSAEEAVALSPAALQPLRNIPIELRVGAREPSEFHRNATLLGERWAPSLGSVNVAVVADRDHFDVLEELDRPDGELLAEAIRLLGLGRPPGGSEGGSEGGAASRGAADGDDMRG